MAQTKYKVTAHKEAPPPMRTGLTEALRALQVNHSLYVPPAKDVPADRQRNRLTSVVHHLKKLDGLVYSVRQNAKGGFDVYRTE